MASINKKKIALVEKYNQEKLRNKAMKLGVTLKSPETVFISADTKFGQNVTIHPYVVIGQKVKIGAITYVAKMPVRKDGILEIYDYESFKYVKKYGTGNTTFIGLFNATTNSWVDEMAGGAKDEFIVSNVIYHNKMRVKTNASKQETNKPGEKPEEEEVEEEVDDDDDDDESEN